MANYKLTNDYWETSGIYDIGQGKTQREINNQIINDIQTESVIDKVPYAFRKTGGDNTVGKREMDKLVGGTVVWNQLADYSTKSGTPTVSGVTYTYANNEFTVTGTATGNSSFTVSSNTPTPVGHVFFVGGCADDGSASTYYCGFAGLKIDYGNGGLWKNTTTYNKLALRIDVVDGYSMPSGGLKFKPIAIDLTKMFGSTVADAIYAMETATAGAGVAYFRSLFPNSYYTYNSGTLMSVNAAAHQTVGFNAWDEVMELGTYGINGTQVTKTSSTTQLRSKNPIPVFPNTTYCITNNMVTENVFFIVGYNDLTTNKGSLLRGRQNGKTQTFTTGAETKYVAFGMGANYGTTYKNDICVSISDPAKNGTYEPYTKHSYPLDSTLTLRGIPKLDSNNKLYYDGDTYESDGTVTRRYGIVDMGSMTWTKSTSGLFQSTSISNVVKGAKSSNDYPDSIRCIKYIGIPSATISGPSGTDPSPDKVFAISQNGAIYVNDLAYSTAESYTTGIAGTYLLYELATPTTESASPYTNPQICDGSGTEEYVDAGVAASERDVSVPVGHETEYMTETASNAAGFETDYSTMIAPTEKDFTATRAYSVNNLFIVSGQLYKATSSIASGAAITVGTNCEATTIGELLTTLLNA